MGLMYYTKRQKESESPEYQENKKARPPKRNTPSISLQSGLVNCCSELSEFFFDIHQACGCFAN